MLFDGSGPIDSGLACRAISHTHHMFFASTCTVRVLHVREIAPEQTYTTTFWFAVVYLLARILPLMYKLVGAGYRHADHEYVS